jgi:orotidine-5'-phosphate decarboxylase
MPRQIFLVPGYGAQGGTAADCAASFRPDGTGAIVNASRSVLFAYHEKQYAGVDWKQAIESAAKAFAQDIAAVTLKK